MKICRYFIDNNSNTNDKNNNNINGVELQRAVSIPVLPRLWERWGGTRQRSSSVIDGVPQANF